MRDLVFRYPTRQSVADFGLVHPVYFPLAVDVEGVFHWYRGVNVSLWAGNGYIMLDPGSGGDPEDPRYVPPTYDDQLTVLFRFVDPYYTIDNEVRDVEPPPPEDGSPDPVPYELRYSRLGQYMESLGVEDTWNGIPRYTYAEGQMLIKADFDDWQESLGTPGHGWL